MEYAIAVLDIGKTNKKVVVYDDDLNQVDSVYTSIPSIPYEELKVENAGEMERWFLENIKLMGEKYPIKAVSITVHGATCALLDGEGNLSMPVIDYTNEVEESLHDEFYELMGSPDELQVETGTAQVKPLINVAKLLYFAKKRFPEAYEKTEQVLYFPQYFAYRLTGKMAADFTYAGCHTYMWDFDKWNWSGVCDKLGLKGKLPSRISKPGDVLGTISPEIASETGLPADTLVTVGIHDSNSSLVPYLVKGEKDFVLNSTGTWCVVMHPSKKYGFTSDEIGKTVFYNISAREELVKTAIFMGGLEFENYVNRISALHEGQGFPSYKRNDVQNVLDRSSDYILPGIVKGAGQFPDSEPRVCAAEGEYSFQEIENKRIPEFFKDYGYAYAVLNLSLAIQTKVALDRIKPPAGAPIYIEGGFRKNDVYIKLVASLYPDSPVYTTDISEATSLGAAMLGKAAFEKIDLDKLKDFISIDMNRVEADSFKGLESYVDSFLKQI